MYNHLHLLAHPGIRATLRLIRQRYIWPGINKDIRNWTRSCIPCQQAKVTRHTFSPIGTFPSTDTRYDHIHIHLVGPLPPSNGCKYLLTCIDRYNHWTEAIPISDATAETVAQAFVSRWIAVFGVPSTITTDRGAQFESALFRSLADLLGIKRIHTTSYHPCANGMVECFHRQLKASLKAQPDSTRWIDLLPQRLKLTSVVHLPNLFMVPHFVFQVNSYLRHLMSQPLIPLFLLTVYKVLCNNKNQLLPVLKKLIHTSQLIFHLVRTSLFAMMLFKSHFNLHTTVLSRFSSAMTNISS